VRGTNAQEQLYVVHQQGRLKGHQQQGRVSEMSIDMGQADKTLRQQETKTDDGVFDRHRERVRWLEIAGMFPSDAEIKAELLQGEKK
jgi:hypothetical protein